MDAQNPMEAIMLKGIGELLKESWQIYCNKIKTIFGIMAVLAGFDIFSEVLMNLLNNTDIKYSVLFSVVLAVTSLVSLFLWFLSIPSLLFAIKEDIGIVESYKRGLKTVIPYAWVYFLFSTLILGGFIFLIIPGILFLVWFSLTNFVLIYEGRKGVDAILRSKFLVSGKFWGVLLRFLLLGLIIFIVYLPLFALFGLVAMRTNSEIISNILGLFTTPFILIYGALIYKNLEEIKKEIPYTEPTLRRKLKYALPGILGAFIIGLMILVWSLNIVWGRDEFPPDDSDLKLSKIEMINQQDNAFYWLAPWIGDSKDLSGRSTKNDLVSKYWPEGEERMKVSKEIYWPQDQSKIKLVDEMVAGKTWDEELAKELLDNNQEALADFDKAASSSYFQDPVLSNPNNINFSTPLFPIHHYRNIAKLDLLKTSYLFNHGQEKEAFGEAVKVVRLGNLMKNSQGNLLNYLVATAIEEMGLNQLRAMLSKTNLPPEDLKNQVRRLDDLRDNGQGLAKAMKMEYATASNYKKIIDMAAEGKLSKKDLESLEIAGEDLSSLQTEATKRLSYLYKSNQTQRFIVEDFRIKIDNAAKTYCNEMDPNENGANMYRQIRSAGSAVIFTENPVGKIFYGLGSVSFIGTFNKKCQENFSIAGTQTLMALKEYRIEKGELPASLQDLVPAYLAEIPRDYFDGSPIRYSREKKIIYSVGQDLKDSGGNTNSEYGDKKMDDISYKIEF